MSLLSASSIIGGLKEYSYRGIQQLPLILTATSLLFSVTTGSISHVNLALGLGLLMPLYSWLCQLLVQFIFQRTSWIGWQQSTEDVCRLVPQEGNAPLTFYKTQGAAVGVPSFWFMSIGFFIGYIISNAVDILTTPAEKDADPTGIEKRYYQGIYLVVATTVFSVLLLLVRFRYMRGCEGLGWLGYILSFLFATGAASIGYGMYTLSRVCGARTSDLFGVLSQILPASATIPSPIACFSQGSGGPGGPGIPTGGLQLA